MVYILHRSSGWNVIRTLPGAEIEQMNSKKKIRNRTCRRFFLLIVRTGATSRCISWVLLCVPNSMEAYSSLYTRQKCWPDNSSRQNRESETCSSLPFDVRMGERELLTLNHQSNQEHVARQVCSQRSPRRFWRKNLSSWPHQSHRGRCLQPCLQRAKHLSLS